MTKEQRQAINRARIIIAFITTADALEALTVKLEALQGLGEIALKKSHKEKLARISQAAAEFMDEGLPIFDEKQTDILDTRAKMLADLATIIATFDASALVQFKAHTNRYLAHLKGLQIR